jgi:choline kinase
MKIAMMAAGIGSRLERGDDDPPKVMLSFNGRTLLQRHLEILSAQGFSDMTIVVGHQADVIRGELQRLGASGWVKTCFNHDYQSSSLLSLWCLREVFAAGEPVIYMDADVLYDHRMMDSLVRSPWPSSVLIDRDVEPDDEPLKVCLEKGAIVDFHKKIQAPSYDDIAEWIGFARFSAESGARLVEAVRHYVDAGKTDRIYEEPMRDVILGAPPGEFGVEDVTGLPWIEIDFPDDLQRAKNVILPKLQDLPDAADRTR